MLNKFRVSPFSHPDEHGYDILIATLGYESRSRAISERYPNNARFRKHACGYVKDHVLKYEDNKRWFFDNNYLIAELPDSEFGSWFEGVINDALEQTDALLNLRVDISSMTRTRLASAIEVLGRCKLNKPMTVDFVYALAEYSPPPPANSRNTHVGPVTPDFSGWWTEPDRAVTAVVGLGYEENKALGVLEHIQASEVWLFVPRSPVSEYSAAVNRANGSLLDMVDNSRVLSYRVDEPFLTMSQIESLCSSLNAYKNVVLVPFGPKLFVLVSLLVSRLHYPDLAVWRVSGLEDLSDRLASEHVYGLRVTFLPTPQDDIAG
jgi:hypothetical protein